ncbi:MAG: DNA gyrase C-terminal beta-propeller domain-containing protein, partial [Acidimicrobiales bacterium]|nr:DNA gyrase C-terminal beta-propeller domain-containing protein [Acidimicrobiales bacterium]
QVLRTPTNGVSIQGRGAAGVAGMKLRADVTVVGAAATIGDEALITVTSNSCAKATPLAELEPKGRGGVGVRVTKLTDDASVTLMEVGEPLGILAIMASDEDSTKTDPNPVPLILEPSRRDLVSTLSERQVLALGPARW